MRELRRLLPHRAISTVMPLLIACCLASAEETAPAPAEQAEPKTITATPDAPPQSELVVTIAGKDYPCRAGGAFTAEVDGKTVAVAVREKPTKLFDYRGIRFDFPKSHAFESDADPLTPMWTLDGNDNVLIVMKPNEAIDQFYTDYIAQLEQNYAGQKVVLQDVRQTFGTIDAVGKKLVVTLDITAAGTTLCQEVYLVKDATHGVIVMIQDSLNDKAEQTAETTMVKKLLTETFAFHD